MTKILKRKAEIMDIIPTELHQINLNNRKDVLRIPSALVLLGLQHDSIKNNSSFCEEAALASAGAAGRRSVSAVYPQSVTTRPQRVARRINSRCAQQ